MTGVFVPVSDGVTVLVPVCVAVAVVVAVAVAVAVCVAVSDGVGDSVAKRTPASAITVAIVGLTVAP
jgi:hypothetical protein